MTKKDYIAIAALIKAASPADGMPLQWCQGVDSARELLANQLAHMMAADNPRFDRTRFMLACGVSP